MLWGDYVEKSYIDIWKVSNKYVVSFCIEATKGYINISIMPIMKKRKNVSYIWKYYSMPSFAYYEE